MKRKTPEDHPFFPCGHPRTAENSRKCRTSVVCRECANARGKAFRERNPGYHTQYSKDWRKLNPDKRYSRKHREKRNREKDRQYAKQWREQHPGYQKDWYASLKQRPLLLAPLPLKVIPKPKGARLVSFSSNEE